jgi:predicted MFS family arabinose efflux permease
MASAVFLVLIPRARGFVPGRRRATPGLSIAGRLGVNLRSPAQLALYAQGFLLMGAFVAVYNYLGFHLLDPPFALAPGVVTLLFLAYLAGTVSSPRAGAVAVRRGRFAVLTGSIGVTAVGAALMIVPSTAVVLVGLVIFTAGFFAAHAVASGWTPVAAAPEARAQASSLYYLGYYGGSSLFGWLLGVVFAAGGWVWFVGTVIAMCAAAAGLAWAALRPGRVA